MKPSNSKNGKAIETSKYFGTYWIIKINYISISSRSIIISRFFKGIIGIIRIIGVIRVIGIIF
jgi:hypothetical protein